MALSLSLLSFKSGEKTNCEIVFLVAGNGIYYVARSNHSLLDIYDLSPFCFKQMWFWKLTMEKKGGRWVLKLSLTGKKKDNGLALVHTCIFVLSPLLDRYIYIFV